MGYLIASSTRTNVELKHDDGVDAAADAFTLYSNQCGIETQVSFLDCEIGRERPLLEPMWN